MISNSPVGATLPAGSDHRMFCRVTGIPIPSLTWLKDGRVLQGDSDRIIIDTQEPHLFPEIEPEFGFLSSLLLLNELRLRYIKLSYIVYACFFIT